MNGIRNVGREEKKVEDVEVAPKDEDLEIFKQSDDAIVQAGKLMGGFEEIYKDPEIRSRATGSAGVVAATGVNYLADAAEETDPDKRSDLREKGATTLLEVFVAGTKTIIAGERRRRERRLKKQKE